MRPARTLADDGFTDVVARAQRGDRDAIETIYCDMQPRLLRFFRLGASREAEDLASDVWAGALRTFPRFEGDLQAFRGWMFTIAYRRLSDHRRACARAGGSALSDDAVDQPVAAPAEHTALDRIGGQEAAQLVARVLPTDQADVVLLRVLGDLDARQVADILGRSETWVRVTQHRGLRRLGQRVRRSVVTG